MVKVSVIIPIYNVELYLHECLDSVIKQTYTNLEIICIDDGCTDISGIILDEYAKNDPRIVAIHQDNAGVSVTRNNALNIATGEYVMFIDADDWLDKYAIEKTLSFSIDNDLDICSFSYISEHGKIILKHSLFYENTIMNENETQIIARRIIGPIGAELRFPLMLDSYGTIWAKLYKRSVIGNVKFEDLNIIGTAEDSLFNMFVYRRAFRTGYLHKYFYHYRKKNVNSETNKFRPWLGERWKVQYAIIKNAFVDSESQKALQNRIAINLFGLTGELANSDAPRRMIQNALKDSIYNKAKQQLDISKMSFPWQFFYYAVKKEHITFIIVFHKLFRFARKMVR